MSNVPNDSYNVVFLIFLLQGIGCLLPWNFVITANQYFENRLKTDNATVSYATNFLSYIGIASKVPNIAFQAINFFILGGFGLNLRILSSIVFQGSMFVLLILLVLFDMHTLTFFWLTIAVVVGINTGNGIYQNCLYGSAALLPSRFINAVVIGNNISGVFSSILILISIWATPDPTLSAFYYFASAVGYLVICLITFVYLKDNPFYSYYKNQQFTDDDTVLVQNSKYTEPEPIGLKKIIDCFTQIWPQCLNTFLVYFISLALFPSVLGAVRATDENIFLGKYFSAVACFFLFNFFAMVGNYSTEYLLPKIPRKVLIVAVLMRFAFIPLFLLCNYQPSDTPRRIPVLIHNDYVFMSLVILHGFSSGWLSSLSMMYTPKIVDSRYKSIAGMISSICLLMGIMIGINFSLIWPYVVLQ